MDWIARGSGAHHGARRPAGAARPGGSQRTQSFNADPRSARLNTEVALLIDSPALAAQVAGFIQDGLAACRAYRVALEGGRLVWRAAGHAGELVFRREPGWTVWRGLWLALLSLLPIRQL